VPQALANFGNGTLARHPTPIMADKRRIPETLFDELGIRMTYEVERVIYELQTEHQHG
jgi:hypothetical protein